MRLLGLCENGFLHLGKIWQGCSWFAKTGLASSLVQMYCENTHTNESIAAQPVFWSRSSVMFIFLNLLLTACTSRRVSSAVFVINVLLVEDIFF